MEFKGWFYRIAETAWSSPVQFLDGYYGRTANPAAGDKTPWNTFKVMFDKIEQMEQTAAAK